MPLPTDVVDFFNRGVPESLLAKEAEESAKRMIQAAMQRDAAAGEDPQQDELDYLMFLNKARSTRGLGPIESLRDAAFTQAVSEEKSDSLGGSLAKGLAAGTYSVGALANLAIGDTEAASDLYKMSQIRGSETPDSFAHRAAAGFGQAGVELLPTLGAGMAIGQGARALSAAGLMSEQAVSNAARAGVSFMAGLQGGAPAYFDARQAGVPPEKALLDAMIRGGATAAITAVFGFSGAEAIANPLAAKQAAFSLAAIAKSAGMEITEEECDQIIQMCMDVARDGRNITVVEALEELGMTALISGALGAGVETVRAAPASVTDKLEKVRQGKLDAAAFTAEEKAKLDVVAATAAKAGVSPEDVMREYIEPEDLEFLAPDQPAIQAQREKDRDMAFLAGPAPAPRELTPVPEVPDTLAPAAPAPRLSMADVELPPLELAPPGGFPAPLPTPPVQASGPVALPQRYTLPPGPTSTIVPPPPAAAPPAPAPAPAPIDRTRPRIQVPLPAEMTPELVQDYARRWDAGEIALSKEDEGKLAIAFSQVLKEEAASMAGIVQQATALGIEVPAELNEPVIPPKKKVVQKKLKNGKIKETEVESTPMERAVEAKKRVDARTAKIEELKGLIANQRAEITMETPQAPPLVPKQVTRSRTEADAAARSGPIAFQRLLQDNNIPIESHGKLVRLAKLVDGKGNLTNQAVQVRKVLSTPALSKLTRNERGRVRNLLNTHTDLPPHAKTAIDEYVESAPREGVAGRTVTQVGTEAEATPEQRELMAQDILDQRIAEEEREAARDVGRMVTKDTTDKDTPEMALFRKKFELKSRLRAKYPQFGPVKPPLETTTPLGMRPEDALTQRQEPAVSRQDQGLQGMMKIDEEINRLVDRLVQLNPGVESKSTGTLIDALNPIRKEMADRISEEVNFPIDANRDFVDQVLDKMMEKTEGTLSLEEQREFADRVQKIVEETIQKHPAGTFKVSGVGFKVKETYTDKNGMTRTRDVNPKLVVYEAPYTQSAAVNEYGKLHKTYGVLANAKRDRAVALDALDAAQNHAEQFDRMVKDGSYATYQIGVWPKDSRKAGQPRFMSKKAALARRALENKKAAAQKAIIAAQDALIAEHEKNFNQEEYNRFTELNLGFRRRRLESFRKEIKDQLARVSATRRRAVVQAYEAQLQRLQDSTLSMVDDELAFGTRPMDPADAADAVRHLVKLPDGKWAIVTTSTNEGELRASNVKGGRIDKFFDIDSVHQDLIDAPPEKVAKLGHVAQQNLSEAVDQLAIERTPYITDNVRELLEILESSSSYTEAITQLSRELASAQEYTIPVAGNKAEAPIPGPLVTNEIPVDKTSKYYEKAVVEGVGEAYAPNVFLAKKYWKQKAAALKGEITKAEKDPSVSPADLAVMRGRLMVLEDDIERTPERVMESVEAYTGRVAMKRRNKSGGSIPLKQFKSALAAIYKSYGIAQGVDEKAIDADAKKKADAYVLMMTQKLDPTLDPLFRISKGGNFESEYYQLKRSDNGGTSTSLADATAYDDDGQVHDVLSAQRIIEQLAVAANARVDVGKRKGIPKGAKGVYVKKSGDILLESWDLDLMGHEIFHHLAHRGAWDVNNAPQDVQEDLLELHATHSDAPSVSEGLADFGTLFVNMPEASLAAQYPRIYEWVSQNMATSKYADAVRTARDQNIARKKAKPMERAAARLRTPKEQRERDAESDTSPLSNPFNAAANSLYARAVDRNYVLKVVDRLVHGRDVDTPLSAQAYEHKRLERGAGREAKAMLDDGIFDSSTDSFTGIFSDIVREGWDADTMKKFLVFMQSMQFMDLHPIQRVRLFEKFGLDENGFGGWAFDADTISQIPEVMQGLDIWAWEDVQEANRRAYKEWQLEAKAAKVLGAEIPKRPEPIRLLDENGVPMKAPGRMKASREQLIDAANALKEAKDEGWLDTFVAFNNRMQGFHKEVALWQRDNGDLDAISYRQRIQQAHYFPSKGEQRGSENVAMKGSEGDLAPFVDQTVGRLYRSVDRVMKNATRSAFVRTIEQAKIDDTDVEGMSIQPHQLGGIANGSIRLSLGSQERKQQNVPGDNTLFINIDQQLAHFLVQNGLDIGHGLAPGKLRREALALERSGSTEEIQDNVSARIGALMGKQMVYNVGNKQVFDALTNGDVVAPTGVLKWLAMPAKVLRSLATTFNPEFLFKAFVRTPLESFVMSKAKGGNPFTFAVDTFNGHIDAWKGIFSKNHPPEWREYLRSGAAGSSFFAENHQIMDVFNASDLANLLSVAGKRHPVLRGYAKVTSTIERFADWTEHANRFTEFRRVLEQGLAERGVTSLEALRKANPSAAKDVLMAAGRAAQEVNLDFGRSGSWGSVYNQYVPFFNAAVQGTDKAIRLLVTDGLMQARRNPVKALRAAGFVWGMLFLPALFQALVTEDDDEYDDIPDSEKAMFWHVPRGRDPVTGRMQYIRIPKPPGLLAAVTTSMVDTMREERREWGDIARDTFAEAMPRDILPMALKLPLDLMAGVRIELGVNDRGSAMRLAIPERMEGISPDLQRAPWTSPTAEFLGGLIGVGPQRVEGLLRGYTGGLGMLSMEGGTAIAEAAGWTDRASYDASDLPIIRLFMSRDPGFSRRTITRLKDIIDYAGNGYQEVQEMKRQVEQGRMTAEEVTQRVESDEDLKFAYGVSQALRSTGDVLSSARREMERIDTDKTMTVIERKIEMDRLLEQIIQAADMAVREVDGAAAGMGVEFNAPRRKP